MKPGTRITLKKMPRNNGRAQLWVTSHSVDPVAIRILHTSGLVEKICYRDWNLAGTSRATLREAQQAVVKWECGKGSKTYFGGYL